MEEEEKKQALESVELIRKLVSRTKDDMYSHRSDLICFIWGVFSLVGFAGQRWLFRFGRGTGLWWALLSIAGFAATIIAIKAHKRPEPAKQTRYAMKGFLFFWIPFLLLAYALAFFCMFYPGISSLYIPVAFLLVISTAFMIIGLLFYRSLFILGCAGFAGSVTAVLYFIRYADIVVGFILGIGLIVTGFLSRARESDWNRGFMNFMS